jgi:hypothetical protein
VTSAPDLPVIKIHQPSIIEGEHLAVVVEGLGERIGLTVILLENTRINGV